MIGHRVERNSIIVSGIIIDRFYSHTFNNTDYYTVYLSVPRGEDQDIFKVIISEYNLNYNVYELSYGDTVKVKGIIRSRSIQTLNNKSNLDIFVFGVYIKKISNEEYYVIPDRNLVCIEGTICRKVYLHSFNNRPVSSGMIACNRENQFRADFIPIYASNHLSEFICDKNIGDTIQIYGRLQARKTMQSQHEKTVFEVVVLKIKDLKEEVG